MPESRLWLVNHLGGAFSLGTSERKFKQLENTWDDAVTVKRLSASHWCAWAIGHDHRAYIYVLSSDVPIRVPETLYENQRWSPIHGFSKKSLLPSDRSAWSSEDGTVDRPKESVRLPSAHWTWEGEWFIDDNLRGEVVGIGGWQYAFDFPATVYSPEKHWNSFVRKRKWVRFRSYSSTDQWARISDAEVVENTECFIDVDVGGFLLPSQPAGFLSVWAVTNNGHVYVRTNVNHDNPEGSLWQEIDIADHMGAINISVGASNLIWAVTWDGNAVVRTEVSRSSIYGIGWTLVEHPEDSTRFMQVSVGKNAVWAISRDGKVWFRKGTSGDETFWNQESAVGTNWVEMVGEMSHIAVSSNDQVFAIDMTGKTVYFRTGVTRSDLTGKTWQAISLHEDLSALEREGLLSEGAVCYCGDPGEFCALHEGLDSRHRFSSTTTSSSSISTATNVDDSVSDVFHSPLHHYPPHIAGLLLDCAPPAWERSHFTIGDDEVDDDNDDDRDHSPVDNQNLLSAPLANLDSSSCPALLSTVDGNDTLTEWHETDVPWSLHQSTSLHTLTSSVTQLTPATSQTSTLSHGSTPEDIKASTSISATSASNGSQLHSREGLGDFGKESKVADYDKPSNSPHQMTPDDSKGTHKMSVLDAGEQIPSSRETATSGTVNVDSEAAETLAQEIKLVPLENVPRERDIHVGTDNSRNLTELTEVDQHIQKGETAQECRKPFHSVGASPAVPKEDARKNGGESLFKVIGLPTSEKDNEVFKLPMISSDTQKDNELISKDDSPAVGSSPMHGTEKKSLALQSSDPKESLEKKEAHKKKKNIPKERQPKFVNIKDDDADSIVFKPQKGKKKKAAKKTRSGSGGSEESKSIKSEESQLGNLSTNSQSADTIRDANTQVTSLPQSQEENIDVVEAVDSKLPHSSKSCDSIDGYQHGDHTDPVGSTESKMLHSFQSCDSTSSYQSLAMNESLYPSALECPDSSLDYFSGDILAAGGYSTDTAINMFTSSEAVQVQQNSMQMSMENKRRLNNPAVKCDTIVPVPLKGVDVLVATNVKSDDLCDRSLESNNAAIVKVCDSKPDNCSNTKLGSLSYHINADKTIPKETASDHIGVDNDDVVCSNQASHNQQAGGDGNVIPAPTSHEESNSVPRVIPTVSCSNREITGDENNSIPSLSKLNGDGLASSSQTLSNQNEGDISLTPQKPHSNLSKDNDDISSLGKITSVLPLPSKENKQSIKIVNQDLKQDSEDIEDTHSIDTLTDNTDATITHAGNSNSGDKSKNALGGINASQDTAKSKNKLDRLESITDSDEIIDFVTDLISDEEESGTKDKGRDVNVPADQADSIAEEKPSELIVPEAASLVKSGRHSRTSLASIKSANEMPHVGSGGKFSESDSDHISIASVQQGSQSSASSSRISSTPPASLSRISSTPPASLPLASLQPARKISRYRKSPSLSNTPSADSLPFVTMSMSQPRLCWRWLDATSCVIDDPSSVEWLSATFKDSEPKKRAVKISRQLRDDVMRKIQERNRREIHRFKDIEQAINRTTWVKKASMQIYLYNKHNRWVACNVELEQGISDVSDGCLTVHYQQKRQQKNTQIALSEITCVKTCSDPENTSGFTVYTSMTNIIHQPLMLKASSENEAAEWIGYLCSANATVWNMNRTILPGAVWSCTFSGDVFVSPDTGTAQKPFDLCWGQHGGHMGLVETGPSGVSWAIGFDKMPYVYNGGYGGAINNGVSAMSDNTQQISDHHRVFVYENQKWFPVIGWCCKGVFQDNFHWQTETGRSVASKDAVKLPSSKWQWTSDWTVDFSTPGGVDKHGWQYSNTLYGPHHPRQHLRNSYRRRRWVRRCRITLLGPWQTAGSLGLADLSIQIDPLAAASDPVVMWAVGANGDVLCRNGVTSTTPLGKSWIHVATDLDKPFKSISIGGNYRVWGIAGDGSAWYRPGVTPFNPAGSRWSQVVPPPPGNFLLHQVSAGATSVWAVDTGDILWRRENITPTFPEGTGWEQVTNRVKRVSVGPSDQVWIVADANFCKWKHGAGVIYNRVGITDDKPSGSDWEVVIGNGWAHVSVRGMKEVKFDESSTQEEDEKWD